MRYHRGLRRRQPTIGVPLSLAPSRSQCNCAIVTFAIGEHRKFHELSLPLMSQYARKHGFDLIVGDGNSYGRPSSWGKVPLLLNVLEYYESALWLDADTIIVDGTQDIRTEIS